MAIPLSGLMYSNTLVAKPEGLAEVWRARWFLAISRVTLELILQFLLKWCHALPVSMLDLKQLP